MSQNLFFFLVLCFASVQGDLLSPTVAVLTLNVTGGATLTDWTVNVTLPYKSGMRSDFQDVQFIDSDGNQLVYWIESVSDGVEAAVWLRIPTLVDGTTVQVVTVSSLSSGDPYAVFPLYDDFATFDTTKWTGGGTGSYSASKNDLLFTTANIVWSDPPTYIQTLANFVSQDLYVEFAAASFSSVAIPEVIVRANVGAGYGVIGRADCRTPESDNHQSYMIILDVARQVAAGCSCLTPFPSDGTTHTVGLLAVGNNFALYLDNEEMANYTSSAVQHNADGNIIFQNHFGYPVSFRWVRARKATAETILVTTTDPPAPSSGACGPSVENMFKVHFRVSTNENASSIVQSSMEYLNATGHGNYVLLLSNSNQTLLEEVEVVDGVQVNNCSTT